MKKTTAIRLLALSFTGFLLSACEDGSYFNSNTTQLHSDKVGRIEAVGEDLRVYEFTPQTQPDTQCVFVAGEGKSGLHCEPKK